MTPYNPKDFSALARLDAVDAKDAEGGSFEITIKVDGAARVNRLLSWIVRSHAYDDVTSLAVALVPSEEDDQIECA